MRALGLGLAILWLLAASAGAQGEFEHEDDAAFAALSERIHDAHEDQTVLIKALQDFVKRFPRSIRAAAAHYTLAELYFDAALDLLSADPAFAKDPFAASLPSATLDRLHRAQAAYEAALGSSPDDALKDTILLRLGEVAYDQRDWPAAARRFKEIVGSERNTYVRPLALTALAFTSLAQGDSRKSGLALRLLERRYSDYLESPVGRLLEGASAVRERRYPEAESALKDHPWPQAQYLLAKAYLLEGKPLLAAGAFQKLDLAAPPQYLREPVRFYLGDAFFLSRDYEAAIDKYTVFAREYPDSQAKAAALYRIGCANFEKGAYDEALRAFESVPEDRTYKPLARFMVAQTYLASGRLKEARAAFGRLASEEGFGQRPAALYRYAWVQHSLGDDAAAVKACQKLLLQYPRSPLAPQAQLLLGNLFVELKDYKNARSSYEAVLDIAPKSALAEQALFLMLKFEYDLKNYGFILTSHHYLLGRLSPGATKWKGFSSLILADTYLRAGRIKEARALYAELVKAYANGVTRIYAQDGLAWCDELMGQSRRSGIERQQLKGMLEASASTTTLSHLNDLGLADSFFEQKDYASAYELYARFAKEHGDLPAAATALSRAGDCLYRQKYYSEAVETWKKLIAAQPSSEEARKAAFRVADTLFRAGDYAAAEEAYNGILAASPGADQAAFIGLRLAQAAFYRKDDAQALARAQGVIVRFPAAPEAADSLDLVEALFERDPKRGDFKGFLSRLIAADPRGPAAAQAQFRLARGLFEAKDYPAAAAAFERFSVDHASDALLPKAEFLLGESLFLTEDYGKAAAAFQRYGASFPNGEDAPLALFHLGSARYSLKQYADVVDAYGKLIEGYPDSEYADAARFNLALSYQQSGELDKAQRAFEEFIRRSPQAARRLAALWSLVEVQKGQGAYDAAISTLRRIQAQGAGSGDAALEAVYRIGELQRMTGDVQGARKTWAGLSRMKPAADPYRLQGLVQLAKLYEGSGERSKLVALYDDLARNAGTPAVAEAARERARQLTVARGHGAP